MECTNPNLNISRGDLLAVLVFSTEFEYLRVSINTLPLTYIMYVNTRINERRPCLLSTTNKCVVAKFKGSFFLLKNLCIKGACLFYVLENNGALLLQKEC